MRNRFRPLIIMQLGLVVVSPILLSLAAGLWIDNQFGTSPWATLVAMLVGTLAGFVGMYRLVVRAIGDAEKGDRK